MNQVYLCIDYGTQRVGLAIAFGPLAEPLQIIPTAKVMQSIQKIIEEKGVTELVVGVSEGEMADKTRSFCRELEAVFGLPIHYQNETLSSFEVHENLYMAQANKTKRRGHIDHLAAASILQDFLDEQKVI